MFFGAEIGGMLFYWATISSGVDSTGNCVRKSDSSFADSNQ